MSAGAPWSVKGIDPKAREIAKDLARRSGMTLGEWLNQVILEDGEDDSVVPLGRRPSSYDGGERRSRYRRLDDAYEAPLSPPHVQARDETEIDRVARALDALSARIEAAEHRSTLAVSGVNQAVAGLLARLETTERDHSATSARLEHVAEDLRDEQGRIVDRIRQVEREAESPRSLEALRALETALGKVANQVYEGDARTRASIEEMRADLTAAARRVDRLESAGAGAGEARTVVDSVAGRIAEAEARTSGAIRALETSFGQLDERLRGTEARLNGDRESRFERLASDLAARVEESRAELLSRIETVGGGRFDQVERALTDLSGHVRAAETRSAEAIEKMGHEVLRIAQNLNGRMNGVERSSAEAVSRVAEAVESRMKRGEDAQAQALERLGGEIARISEKLGERIAHAERRSTLAADDMGERIGRLSDKLEARCERTSSEIAERIRQSEERTARLLEEARETIDRSLARAEERAAAALDDAPEADASAESQEAPPAVEPRAQAVAAAVSAPATLAAPDSAWFDVPPFPGQAPTESLFDEPAPAFPAFDQGAAPQEPAFDDVFDLAAREEAPAAPAPAPVQARGAEPVADSFDEFCADTEFLDAAVPERPPVSTKEAIDAARAAARLGVRDRGGDAGLFGPKSKAKARRESSVLRKTFLSSTVAVTLVVTAVGGYSILTEDEGVEDQGDLAVLTAGADRPALDAPLAAVALAPKALDPAEAAARAEGKTLYDEAVAKLSGQQDGALETLIKAANLGYPPAQFHLAKLYEIGEAGAPRDLAEARRWTERAAQGGERRAMHNLGLYAFDGVGGPKDLAAAARWFLSAAKLGLVDSQYNLGRLYEQGLGVPQNQTQAYEWYLIAANAGDEEARAAAESLGLKLGAADRTAAERAAAAYAGAHSDSEPAAIASR